VAGAHHPLQPLGLQLAVWPATRRWPAPCPPPLGPNGPNHPDCQDGSIIECQNQVLGESVGITGTPFTLNYRSNRVAGRKSDYTLDIPLSGATVPPGLRRIEVEIFVAGRMFTQSFPPTPNQHYAFTWDGKDVYGRTLQGTSVKARVGYVYEAVYQEPAQLAQSFAALSGVPLTGNRARQEVTLWQETQGALGSLDFRPGGVGGWSLNARHAYDPVAKVLYLGDGTRRDAQANGTLIITSMAGHGELGFGGDGGPALRADIGNPFGVAFASDGTLYIAQEYIGQEYLGRIRRVAPNGTITSVAGNATVGGSAGFSGDGGPATQAAIRGPSGIAVAPDGSFYFADSINQRIRRVGIDGIITTVAGNGTRGFTGDGSPATQATLLNPTGLALAPDGSLYIADRNNDRIRRVGPDGIITTVAGNGYIGLSGDRFSGDGGPATQAGLFNPYGVALAPDGSLYIADLSNHRIRRVGPDGIITTVAGNGVAGSSGDGGPATQASLRNPQAVAVTPDGGLYIADTDNHRIRRVDPAGFISTVAGKVSTGFVTGGFRGDSGPAPQSVLSNPKGVAVAPDGSLYIADSGNSRVRRITSSMPGLGIGDTAIASEDGTDLYIFNGDGLHLRTLNALTGGVRFQFGYDSTGRLSSIVDGDGNQTTIERDGSGSPTAIVAPFGQRTTLTVDANGYLSSVANPANQTQRMTYTEDGLLTAFTDPKGHGSVFTYDPLGRLSKDQNAAGGFWALSRTEQANGYTVTLTSALNRTVVYQLENIATGDQRRRTTTAADGTVTETLIKTDGSQRITYPDGTVDALVFGPDPRWGMQAPVLTSLIRTTPGGLVQTITRSRTATLTNPLDPLSMQRAGGCLVEACGRAAIDRAAFGQEAPARSASRPPLPWTREGGPSAARSPDWNPRPTPTTHEVS
jgi:YD repeat-containing protein